MLDTYTVTLHQGEFSFPNKEEFVWSEPQVKFLINYAISNSDINIDQQAEFKNFAVSEIIPRIVYSKVAYIEATAGYFIVSEDMMQHLNITYSRWD